MFVMLQKVPLQLHVTLLIRPSTTVDLVKLVTSLQKFPLIFRHVTLLTLSSTVDLVKLLTSLQKFPLIFNLDPLSSSLLLQELSLLDTKSISNPHLYTYYGKNKK
jgi:hypothetical protein